MAFTGKNENRSPERQVRMAVALLPTAAPAF
jgi:hypothetical protein